MTTHEALRAEVAAIRKEIEAMRWTLRAVEARLFRISLIAEDVHLLEEPDDEIVWDDV